MIVYSGTKQQFSNDVLSNDIGNIILDKYRSVTGRNTTKSEITSWTNSLQYMDRVLDDGAIPDDAGIAIEYHIPRSSNRIDFIITGLNSDAQETAVLIELKQWTEAALTGKDGVISTRFLHGVKEVTHPSFQVWSYQRLLEDFNATVQEENIQLRPCAYLHNYTPDQVITNEFFAEYIEKAPIFLKPDALKLREFIKNHIRKGDRNKILYRIDHGRIRPSKSLADELSSLLQGNEEFIMIDDQKVVFETAIKLARESSSKNKNVLVVQGGPGTGKTVLAMNLLVKLTNMGLVAQYVSRNSAPREVYQVKLTGSFKKSHISNLFSGSGSYHSVKANTFGTLIVDEAHRLNAKSGMFSHLGENQIKEIINASEFSIFFIDEDQRVTLKDIGDKSEIDRYAEKGKAKVTTMSLESQFRCNGSDGYLAWLDNVLGIKETANQTLEGINYDFQLIDDPKVLHDVIKEKNKDKNKARMVAGYCWKWVSKKMPHLKDIVIGDYSATWNLDEDGQAWIIKPDSVTEVGCIHTCQGLEVDYVGVIIGPDIVMRDGKLFSVPEARASTDKSVHGWKKMLKEEGEETTRAKLDLIIKNTYRTLLTRGQKGCYVYICEDELRQYFKDQLGQQGMEEIASPIQVESSEPSPLSREFVQVPFYDSIGCGEAMYANPSVQEMIDVSAEYISKGAKYFVLQTRGDSMNAAGVYEDALVLCQKNYHPQEGEIVVALIGDDATLKVYKRESDAVVLEPRSTNPEHKPRRFTQDDEELKIQGTMVRILDID